MPLSQEDISFGVLTVKLGYTTQERVEECLRIQERIQAGGLNPKSLAEIMTEMGYLTTEQVDRIMSLPLLPSVNQPSPIPKVDVATEFGMEQLVSLPGYKIIEQIGIGKTGTVYKATQLSLERIVAVKILLPYLAHDKKFVERFFNEARAVARLNHPNIVQGIDVGESKGLYYFVMEYIDGPTLERMVREKGLLGEALACDFVLQISRVFGTCPY